MLRLMGIRSVERGVMMSFTKTHIHLLVAVTVGVLIFFLLPPVNGLTPTGVALLSVFIPTVYLWLTVGTGWTSVLSITVVSMLMVATPSAAFGTLWGQLLVCALIPFMMVATVLEETGAFEWIVKWFISRKFVHGRPILFIIMYVIAMIIISIFAAPQVVAVLFLSVFNNVSKAIGYDRDSKFCQAGGLLVAWVAQISDGILIWGRPYVLACVGVIAGLGFTSFTAMDYLVFAIGYLAVAAIAAILLVVFVIRPDMNRFENYDDAAIREELKTNPINKRGKIALAGMMVILISFMLPYMPFLGVVAEYFSTMTIVVPITFVAIMLCVISVDGKPVMDFAASLAKVPWPMIVFLGAIMFYAGNLNGADFGITTCLTNILGPIVSAIPIWATIVIGFAVAALITNFCSNTVAAVAVLSGFVPAMLGIPGIDLTTVLAFACCIIAICGTAFATPAASPTMSIVYSKLGIKYKGTAKYSILLIIIMLAFSSLVLMPLCSGIVAGVAVLG